MMWTFNLEGTVPSLFYITVDKYAIVAEKLKMWISNSGGCYIDLDVFGSHVDIAKIKKKKSV